MRIAFANEKLAAFAGPGRWNDPDMMIVGMPGLSEAQNRSLFSLWCMMASPLIAGNDLRAMDKATIDILTNLEAIAVDQDPLGAQGHIVWNDGNVSLWAGKPLFDGSQAVSFSSRALQGQAEDRLGGARVRPGPTSSMSATSGRMRRRGPSPGASRSPSARTTRAFLRLSKKNDFPIPPFLVADTYLVSLRSTGARPETLTGKGHGHEQGQPGPAALARRPEVPPALAEVEVAGGGKAQTFVNTVSTAGLKKGAYHALVRADNVEPVSGKPMSALYYDVDLEVGRNVRR